LAVDTATERASANHVPPPVPQTSAGGAEKRRAARTRRGASVVRVIADRRRGKTIDEEVNGEDRSKSNKVTQFSTMHGKE
jgi:hypothetical protein